MGHSFLLYNYFIFFFFQSNRFLVNTRNAINSLWEHNTICPRSVTTLNWGLAGHTKRPKPEQKLNASAILGSIKRSVCRFMFVHLEYAQHSTAEKTIWLTWLYFVHWARSLFSSVYLFTDIQSIAVALANWRATTADATATTEIVNKHDATRLEAAVQLCSLYWFSAFFSTTNVCGTHVLHLLCLLFVLANLPWAVHVPVCGMTFPLLWLCAQWQNRELTRICFWVRVLSIITEINIVCGVFEYLATLLLTCGSRLSFKYWLFQLGGSLQQVLSYQQGVGMRLIICVSRQHFMRVYERG